MGYRHVDDAEWLDTAKRLPVNGRVRIRCCSSRKTALVSRKDRGYFFHCFSSSCGRKEQAGSTLRSIDQVAASMAAAQVEKMGQEGWRLPKDFTLDIPNQSAVPAYRCGLSKKVLNQVGIGWSPSLSRIVVPRSHQWFETSWTARATLPSQKPKWLSSPSLQPWLVSRTLVTQSTVCLVEDAFSAVRLAKFLPTLALFATTFTSNTLAVIPIVKNTLIWMDGDRPGRAAAQTLRRHLELVGRTSWVITTEKDPKFYSDDEIRKQLGQINGI